MTTVEPKTDPQELLEDKDTDEVIAKLTEMHDRDAVKIDHVNRGEPQECWSCGKEEKGFHLYKAESQFFKLCDSCSKTFSTLLARLVENRNQAAAEEAELAKEAEKAAAEEAEAAAEEAELAKEAEKAAAEEAEAAADQSEEETAEQSEEAATEQSDKVAPEAGAS